MTKQNEPWQDIADAAGILRAHKQMELADHLQKHAEALAQPEQEPVALNQVYRCKIKSRSQINKEIPREKQGWWADISAGQKLLLRQAVQADLDRCSLNDAHSKDPADYMCETQTNGSLVSKIALEYMNPEQNVFASTTPPPVTGSHKRKPLSDQVIKRHIFEHTKLNPNLHDDQELIGYIVNAARAIEAAHGIKEKNT